VKNGVRLILLAVSLGIAAFWVWALFFPPKQAVARLDDVAWTERADGICREANLARNELTDTRRIEDVGEGALTERADLIDRATDIVSAMIDEVMAIAPTGPDDRALTEKWAGYYRTLLDDRRAYTEVLRGGDNPPFPETTIDGSPISEYINDFTVANRMKACSSPADLAA
jgi:hypothetical protein